jgi:hypothetical protein
MNGKALATLGITLGFATLGHVALAQSTTEAPADFSPPRPATMQDPGIATGSATAAEQAAPATATSEPAPAVMEEAPATAVVEEAPPAPIEQADARATTRRAAPDRIAPRDRHDPNPQTGHYLGHGLFNNWGPNDFGA